MKKIALATLVVLAFGNASAQAPKIVPSPNLQSLPSQASDLEKRLAALEAKVTSLQTENSAQKEQIINLKTSAKAIDMVLTELKGKYENHVHMTGNYRISGFYAQKLNPNGQPLKFLTTQQAESAPQYSGKPEEAK